MKKILLIALLIGAMLSVSAYVVCVATPLLSNGVKGSGKIVTKTIPAPDFVAIDASRAVKVIVSDKVSNIRIDADDNLIDLVVVRADKGELEVSLDQKIQNIQNANITVTVPANGKIRSLDASSASTITSNVALRADKFEIDASSAAKINATVDATLCKIEASSASKVLVTVKTTTCSAEASSAAKIELKGTTESFKADLSSASKLNGSELSAVNASIDTSSAASASIHCTGKLAANASSGSSIRYTGDCQTALSKSSGGSVRKN